MISTPTQMILPKLASQFFFSSSAPASLHPPTLATTSRGIFYSSHVISNSHSLPSLLCDTSCPAPHHIFPFQSFWYLSWADNPSAFLPHTCPIASFSLPPVSLPSLNSMVNLNSTLSPLPVPAQLDETGEKKRHQGVEPYDIWEKNNPKVRNSACKGPELHEDLRNKRRPGEHDQRYAPEHNRVI